MALYFLRHGQSEANLAKVFAGKRNDSPLTENWREQAKQAALDWGKTWKIISRIITSPLIRTVETAQIFASIIGFPWVIEFDNRISEYDMGEMTWTPTVDIDSKKMISSPGAENPLSFLERIQSAIQEYSQGEKNILLVSHAGVGRMLYCIENKIAPEFFYEYKPLGNAEVIQLHF